MQLLASNRCKKILALSDFAYGFAKRRFEKFGHAQLVDKMGMFRGAIRDPFEDGDLVDNRGNREPFSKKPLSAVVIGTHLFRKGGMHAIQAFERLRANGINVALTLIGDFETESYAFGKNIPDADEWRERARSHSWIRFQGPIPNAQVFPELLAHDVCIYTSLDESLGWLPIEAGMLGVPVLANRVCAFSELVSDKETGWLIDLPLREDGRWAGLELEGVPAKAALESANAAIIAGIEECMTEVYEHPERLSEWGKNAREKIKATYDLDHASRALELIYDSILNR
jgi:glycosyltransferase involved in cell wall biosynthesis